MLPVDLSSLWARPSVSLAAAVSGGEEWDVWRVGDAQRALVDRCSVLCRRHLDAGGPKPRSISDVGLGLY